MKKLRRENSLYTLQWTGVQGSGVARFGCNEVPGGGRGGGWAVQEGAFAKYNEEVGLGLNALGSHGTALRREVTRFGWHFSSRVEDGWGGACFDTGVWPLYPKCWIVSPLTLLLPIELGVNSHPQGGGPCPRVSGSSWEHPFLSRQLL